MLRNYLTIAVRNLLKQKTFTLINVSGLAVGVACCMILGLYAHHEMSYDRHHPDAERIYRVIREDIDETGNGSFANGTSGSLSKLLRTEVPGIRTCVRVMRTGNWVGTDERGFMSVLCVADPEILEVFSLPMVRGDRRTALSTPRSVLVPESVAWKYFGEADPVGQVVQIERWHQDGYTIAGVLKDLPRTSLLQFDFLITNASDASRFGWDEWWVGVGWKPIETYVVLGPTSRSEGVEQRLESLVPRYAGDEARGRIRHHLQPIVRAHLFAREDYGFSPNGLLYYTDGDIRRLYVVAILGAFILVLAGINFVNLSTARSTMRAREVGTRKAVGAHRGQIAAQFLGESVLLSAFAHLLAVLTTRLLLPWVSSWLGITLSITHAGFWLLLPGSVLIVGVLAGGCPAYLISRFRPVAAMKGVLASGPGGTSLRWGLVLLQFSVSVLLIAGTWVVLSQWRFMVGKDPGYDKENVVVLPIFRLDPSLRWPRSEEVRQRFLRHPNVLYACATNDMPVGGGGYAAVRPEGEAEDWHMHRFDLSEDVLNVFGIELVQGRDFSSDIQSDLWGGFILNESAVKALGWKDPVGKSMQLGEGTGHVIGVVRDFHFQSMKESIEPLFLRCHGGQQSLSLRISSENLPETMAFLRKTWAELTPNRPFEYEFLDQKLEAVYRADMKAGQIFLAAAGLAILIACLGLVGLALFSTEQRTRDIGIRKALGATWPGLVALFTRDFVKLVAIANLLALPVSVYLTRMWLSQFAYRIEMGPWPFLFSAGLSLLIATTTVCLITFRAATRNPVDALRHE